MGQPETEPQTGADMGLFHPSRAPFRYSLLVFVSMLTFGSYFAYDSIGAIETTLIKELHLGRETIGNSYTFYSIAAIAIVFFGGFLIDRLGTRKASLLFSTMVTLGAVIVALARDTLTLYLGRFVFGAGSESLVVAQSAILAKWFKGKELALAFGISLSISRLGTLFSFNTMELIADHWKSYQVALWSAAVLCAVSLASNLVYNLMDLWGERELKLADEGGGDKIVFSDVRQFPPSFWYVTALCVTFYSAIFPFTALSTDMFHEKWGLPTTTPGTGSFISRVFGNYLNMFNTAPGVTSIIIFASMVFAPFAGHLIDRIGRRASLMVVGSLVLIPCHLALGLTHVNPVVPMVALGAAFVLVPAAMWPSVPLVVDKSLTGTAFGLMTAIQNVGLALFPFLNGRLRDMTKSYMYSQVMFACLGIVGLLFALKLLQADRAADGALERGAGPRKEA